MLFEAIWHGMGPTCKVPWGLGPQKPEMEETYRIRSSCSFPRQYKSVPYGTFSSAVSRLILFLNDSYDRVSSSSIGDWTVARTTFFFFFFFLLWLYIFGFIQNFEVCNLYWALTDSRLNNCRENFTDFIPVSWDKQIPERSSVRLAGKSVVSVTRKTSPSMNIPCEGQM